MAVVQPAQNLEDQSFNMMDSKLMNRLVKTGYIEGKIIQDQIQFLLAIYILDDQISQFNDVWVVQNSQKDQFPKQTQ